MKVLPFLLSYGVVDPARSLQQQAVHPAADQQRCSCCGFNVSKDDHRQGVCEIRICIRLYKRSQGTD